MFSFIHLFLPVEEVLPQLSLGAQVKCVQEGHMEGLRFLLAGKMDIIYVSKLGENNNSRP